MEINALATMFTKNPKDCVNAILYSFKMEINALATTFTKNLDNVSAMMVIISTEAATAMNAQPCVVPVNLTEHLTAKIIVSGSSSSLSVPFC
jgi:chemotaxis response regulator CheB